MKNLKVVVVGDEIAKKTELLTRYVISDNTNEFSSVTGNLNKQIVVDDQTINLQLWDTSGSQDYKKLRHLSYPQTDIFIIVFALISPTSLENVETIWVPEIREDCPGTPYILVGTCMNARNDFDKHKEEYESEGWEAVPSSKGEEMRTTILANDYIECDSNSKASVERVFLKAAKIGLNHGEPEIKKDLLTIGLYSENNESKKKIALEYILGEFHKGEIPSDHDSFFKIEYMNGDFINVTVDIDNQRDLSKVSAMLFIYDIGVESLEKLKSMFNEIQKSNKNKIPYALALNLQSENQEDEILDKSVDELIRDFKCNLFRIKNYSKEDIEDIFFYLNQEIAERISRSKKTNKRKLKIKRKSKSKKKSKSKS